jgi:hypothetical protein
LSISDLPAPTRFPVDRSPYISGTMQLGFILQFFRR